MSTQFLQVLAQLSGDQVQVLVAATKAREKRLQASGVEFDRLFSERVFLDYAEEMLKDRPLEIGISDLESVIYERNYRGWYESPRQQ